MALKYLAGYNPALVAQVQALIDAGQLAQSVRLRHPQDHAVRSDRALFAYVDAMRLDFLRNAAPLAKVVFDNKLHVVEQALGTHTTISRVQGNRLVAKREIRIASVFKEAPADFLRMIVVHETAHLRERDHNKAFYALCVHMEPAYHDLEFDLRLWLTARELRPAAS
jgi:UTP pyrophosphatase